MTAEGSEADRVATAPVVVYSPESQLRRPGALLSGMFGDLKQSRELAWRLFARGIQARYRQTALGYAWAVIPPLVGTAAFLFLRQTGIFAALDLGIATVPFLITSIVLWQTFAESVTAPLRVVHQSRSLLAKLNFPREALILAATAEVLFSLLLRSILVAGALIWFRIDFWGTMALGLLATGVLVVLGIAIGLFLVPLGMLYQDVEYAMAVILSIWMFVTPVFYPAPTAFPASLTMTLNPASAILDTARSWLLGLAPGHLVGFVWVSGFALVLLCAGWLLYRLSLPILIERMSA